MLGFIEKLLIARSQVANEGLPSVTISLPLDDPRAQRLKEIAQKLLVPKTTIRSSGLTTSTGIACPENADSFLKSLREELGEELMAAIEGDLTAQLRLKQKRAVHSVKDEVLGGGKTTGTVLDDVLSSGLMQNVMAPGGIEKLGNIASQLLTTPE